MPRDWGIAHHLADRFDEVVSEGPAPAPAPDPPRGDEPDEAEVGPGNPLVAAFQAAFEELREDVRQGLGAAAQVQFSGLASLRAQVEQLAADLASVKEAQAASTLPVDAVRDELQRLETALTPPPAAAAAAADVAALLRQELERDRGRREVQQASVLDTVIATRAEVQAVRAQVEAAKAATGAQAGGGDAAALASVQAALADLRTLVERNRTVTSGVSLEVTRAIENLRRDLASQRPPAPAAGTVGAPAESVAGPLRELTAAVAELRAEDERAREAASAARHDLMQTLEAFHDELVEQWRERKVFEASVPAVLETIRLSLADGMGKLSAGVALVPAAIEATRQEAETPVLDGVRLSLADAVAQMTAGLALLPAAVESHRQAAAKALPKADGPVGEPGPEPDELVLKEVAALRGELADRAGELDEFLRTAVSGANRWFVKMRDDLYGRIDEFGRASVVAGGGDGDGDGDGRERADPGAVMAAIEVLQTDVRALHTYLSMLDSNLQRFHDVVMERNARS